MKTSLRVYAACVLFVLTASLGIWLLAPLLIPLIVSVALYALLEPAVSRLHRIGLGRTASVIVALLLVLLLLTVAMALIAPQIFDQLALLQQRLPAVIAMLSEGFAELTAWLRQRSALPMGDSGFFELLSNYSSELGKNMLLGVSSGFVQLTVVMLLVPLFTYFLLVDYRSLRNHVMSWVGNRHFELSWLIYYRVARQLQQYIRGVLLQSLLMALMSALGFALIGLEMWMLLGALTGLLNLIPYVGPLLALGLAVFVGIAQAGPDASLLLASVLVIVFAQLVDNAVVIPAVVAEAADLHPLTVIVGVIIFGNVFGFAGMVLAVPALAAMRIVFGELRRGLRPPVVAA